MKSGTFSLAILLALAVSCHGFVCTADYCRTKMCPYITKENCVGKFVKNGSTCECCNACLTILKPGESCITLVLSGGDAPTVTCPDGYICDRKSKKCQLNKVS